jgi:aminopeptidase N
MIHRFLPYFIFLSHSIAGFSQLYPNDSRSTQIDVLHYDLTLDFRQFSPFVLKGQANIQVLPLLALDSIEFDLKGLAVDSVKLGQAPLPFLQLGSQEKVRLYFSPPLQDTAIIHIHYQGLPQQDPSFGGFYQTQGFAFNVGVSLTEIPPSYGRTWFPCLDYFTDKAPFDYKIWMPDAKAATAGGHLMVDSLDGQGGRYMHYRQSLPIPPYLASVAVADFEFLTDSIQSNLNGNSIPKVLAARAQDTAAFSQACLNLDSAFHIFEHRFGPFRFSKVGYSLVPMTGGAMEHAENIAYPISLGTAGLAYQDVLVHELSHAWWGNLATCRTADDMWLNEGFASYSEWAFNEIMYSRGSYMNLFRSTHKELLQHLHWNEQGYWPVSGVPPQHIYSSTTYSKGADLIHSLRGVMGDSLFFSSIQIALQQFSFENWDAASFQTALEQASGINLNSFFQEWIRKPGWTGIIPEKINFIHSGNQYDASTYLTQHLKGKTGYTSGIPVELTWLGTAGQEFKQTVLIQGDSTLATATLPFEPKHAVVNRNEALGLAETATDSLLSNSGNYSLGYAMVNAAKTSSASYRMFAGHRWTGANGWGPGLMLNPQRHWSFYFPDGAPTDLTLALNYNGRTTGSSARLDNELIVGSEDSLVLLFRPHRSAVWTEATADPTVALHVPGANLNDKIGRFDLFKPQSGEYCIGKKISSGISKETGSPLHVFPNPVKPGQTLYLPQEWKSKRLSWVSGQGRLLNWVESSTQAEVQVPSIFSAGVYYIVNDMQQAIQVMLSH